VHPALTPFWGAFDELIALTPRARLDRLNTLADQQDLRNAFRHRLRFGPAQANTKAADYEWAIGGDGGLGEGHIATRREGPEAIHDVFNALVWLAFPRTKALLNRLQVEQIKVEASAMASGTSGSILRGKLRDQITLFDENGAVLLGASPDVIAALNARHWEVLFEDHRDQLERDAGLLVLGHGLLQKCCRPFKSMTARVWVLPLPATCAPKDIDEALAESLAAAWPGWVKCLLPITGWPGWGIGAQDQSYYRDSSVFRPLKIA
jgi:Protein of unknown function (DUF3025)